MEKDYCRIPVDFLSKLAEYVELADAIDFDSKLKLYRRELVDVLERLKTDFVRHCAGYSDLFNEFMKSYKIVRKRAVVI
ncbi:MAG: hypothetical protein DRJ18_00415 [Candidatus Methanomethylicota archaeon]|nr:MAG: hypothetical protein DRJ18_00415 [Candidatus Verstraetearchaeota archaeon]